MLVRSVPVEKVLNKDNGFAKLEARLYRADNKKTIQMTKITHFFLRFKKPNTYNGLATCLKMF